MTQGAIADSPFRLLIRVVQKLDNLTEADAGRYGNVVREGRLSREHRRILASLIWKKSKKAKLVRKNAFVQNWTGVTLAVWCFTLRKGA
jgi:hypothetical protein